MVNRRDKPLTVREHFNRLYGPFNSLTTGAGSAVVREDGSRVILASNSERRFAEIVNESGSAIYLSLGAGSAVVGKGRRLDSTKRFTIDPNFLYTGTVEAIASGDGTKTVSIIEV